MDRSPGFGSTPCDCRPIQTRFRFGSAYSALTSPQKVTRRLILQEARHHPCLPPGGHRALTACKHTVSGSFHSPHRGSFHLSLTVLVHYRSSKVFSLGRWTSQLPTGLACPMVLRNRTGVRKLSCTGVSPALPALSNALPLARGFLTPSGIRSSPRSVLQPHTCNACRLTQVWFRLIPFRSPLLRESYLFLAVLRCFSSRRAPR